jgi:choline dehydrogenase-like flavoprotein
MKKRLVLLSLLFSAALQAGVFGPNGDTADYIVIGAGTAGCVVAKRLTDDMETSVIVIHNGPNLTEDPLIKFSAGAAITVPLGLVGPPLYENGETTPQSGADNRELTWAVALPEGGASSINAGSYVRGTNEVYAQWEAIAGPNWSLDRILAIYKELETYIGETNNPAARGESGPISVLQVQNPSEVSLKFTQAVTAATGFPVVLDFNDPLTPIGPTSQVQYTQSGLSGELRVSSATAFLNSLIMAPFGLGVHGRKLRVLFEAVADKTIWSDGTAVGVEYLYQGETRQAFARKGVIVCAGLFTTPFLLRSGVGPEHLLQSLDVPVVFNNPNVGQAFVDHPAVRLLFTSDPLDTSLSPVGISGLFNQITHLPDPTGDQTVRQLRLAIANPFPGVVLATFDLLQPKSRGSVSIDSIDPTAPPVVDIGVLTDPADLALYQRGFQVYIKNLNTALQGIDSDYEIIFPDIDTIDDLPALTAFIRSEVASNESFQSHCRMAPQAQQGVVDSTGRVYGVEHLFIADDSIVPLCMDGAPMASAYLIGMNIANLIIANANP